MLHLLPLRALALAVAIWAFLAAAVVVYGDNLVWGVRLLPFAYPVVGYGLLVVWRRWKPAQKAIFPYLGGEWKGTLSYDGKFGKGEKTLTMTIKHTLLELRMNIMTDESSSITKFVYPMRDKDFAKFDLHYAYTVERSVGQPGPKGKYDAYAHAQYQAGRLGQLNGNYFTEVGNEGVFTLQRVSTGPFWALWK